MVGIGDFVVVLRFIDQRVFAAGNDGDVFDAIAIEMLMKLIADIKSTSTPTVRKM